METAHLVISSLLVMGDASKSVKVQLDNIQERVTLLMAQNDELQTDIFELHRRLLDMQEDSLAGSVEGIKPDVELGEVPLSQCSDDEGTAILSTHSYARESKLKNFVSKNGKIASSPTPSTTRSHSIPSELTAHPNQQRRASAGLGLFFGLSWIICD